MPQPLSFVKELTKKRVCEEVEAIEAEVRPGKDGGYISNDGITRLRELRLALETKPLVDSIQ